MKLALHYPEYLPRPGFFYKLMYCDLVVLLDEEVFSPGGACHQALVRGPAGVLPLILPVYPWEEYPIREIKLWQPDTYLPLHWQALRYCYAEAPYYRQYQERLEEVYRGRWTLLAEFNTALIQVLASAMSIDTPLVMMSELGMNLGVGTERILTLCRRLGADCYLSCPTGVNGIDPDVLREAGIGVECLFQPLVTDLSAVDLIFNLGQHYREALQKAGSQA